MTQPGTGEPPLLIDAHLDLAYNALQGRDLTKPLEELRAHEQREAEEAMVTLPELNLAGISIAFATLFVMPNQHAKDPKAVPTYATPDEARCRAIEQLELYEQWEERRLVNIIRTREDFERQVSGEGSPPPGLVLLMEGADPVREPSEIAWWWERGVRLLGPAWKATRYAGGTGMPGPLSELGLELLDAMAQSGMALDVSHLAEESFWQALDNWRGPLLASHSNARAFVDSDRHLSDAMIRALAEQNGMIGLVLANSFLKPGVTRQDPKGSVTISDVARQAQHIAKLAGWDKVGIGSDFDGGFGRQEVPLELERGANFQLLGAIAPPDARRRVLGGNWATWLRESLPAT